MSLKELYHPESGRMRVAGAISGTGSNLRKIIEHSHALQQQNGRSPYEVVVILSNDPTSNVEQIGRDYGIPVISRNLKEFYETKGVSPRDLEARAEFDQESVDLLTPHKIDAIAYAGYMSIVTPPLLNAFLGINVHPALLTKLDREGKRAYTGDNAVAKAIAAGESYIHASTHILEERVDYGPVLMVSPPMKVILPPGFDKDDASQLKQAAKDNQNRLKEVGDWKIFPRTLEWIADGKFSRDDDGKLYFGPTPIPYGVEVGHITR